MNSPKDEEQPGPTVQTEYEHGRVEEVAPRTAIGPEYHVVLGWVAPALKEVEEKMAHSNVDVPSVRPAQVQPSCRQGFAR
jgi:hypothetical protein